MTVYIDNSKAKVGCALMSIMIADTDAELHAVAERIGVHRMHHKSERGDSYYQVTTGKRNLALAAGAIHVGGRQLECMRHRRRLTGKLGRPEDAIDWARAYLRMVTGSGRTSAC